MSTTPEQASAYELVTTSIDQSPESHVTRLHRAVIGPVSADYYLPVLARLDTRDQPIPIWNWAACLCTFNWMVFRGLWTPALLYVSAVLGVAMAVLAVTQLATPVADSIQWSLWAGAVTLALLVPGFFGNAWLYAVYRKRLASALSGTASVQEACVVLNRQASSRPRLVWIVFLNLVLAGLLLASWLALPIRQRQGPVDGDLVSAVTPGSSAAAPITLSAGPAAESAGAAAGAVPASAIDSEAAAVVAAPATSAPAPASTQAVAPAPAVSEAALAPAPVSSEVVATPQATMAADDATATKPAAATSASVGVVAPLAPEMRRSTRFGETPRKAIAIPPRAAASEPAPPPAKPTATKPTGRFIINVGLFAQDDNARRVTAKLREAGLPVVTQELQRASGSLTRVRAGPFVTRAEADDAAQKIRALKLDAVVVRQ